MRIAICISGFIRTWEHTKKSFMEQIYKNNSITIDVFIHTYKQNYYEFTAGKKDVTLTEDDFKKLFEGINVKYLIIEDRDKVLPEVIRQAEKYKHVSNYGLPQKESSDPNSKEIPIGVRTYDHLRKIHLCNESRKEYEKKNNIKYDLVVKTRFDVVYFNPVKWENFT